MTGVLTVPELSLVVLVGASGSGKSTFAARHFGRYETVSSDVCRGLVSNDETDQAATGPAFELLHFIAGKRLAAGHLTVVDATNVQADARKHLLALAREHDVLPVAILFDVPESVCVQRNAARPRRVSAACTPCVASRRSRPPRSCGSGCSTTSDTRPAPSMSLGTCTGVSASWSPCSGASATRSSGTAKVAASAARTPKADR